MGLQMRRRFWEEDDEIYGGGSITDMANRMIYYPSHRFGEEDGVVLASYTWETEARGWGSLTKQDQAVSNHTAGERTESVYR